jgi:hypothetical protein
MVKHFTLILRAASGRDSIRSLRTLLKIAGRHLGLRAINVRENTTPRAALGGVVSDKQRQRTTKMDMRKYTGSRFIKCDDVRSGPLLEKIVDVEIGKFDKPNITFASGAILSANATNVKALVRAFGADSESWIGHDVELFLGEIEYQAKPQEAVLLRTPSEAEFGKSPKKKPTKPTKVDYDDSVEF